MRSVISMVLLCGGVAAIAGADVCVDGSEKLIASDANSMALFGVAVDLDVSTLVVGASDNATSVDNGGAVYVFEDSGSGWVETAMLESDDLDASDFVGFCVAVEGDIIAAGAWGDDEMGLVSGAVYVFERDLGGTDNWGQRVKLTMPDAEANDLFGFDIALDGGTLVVGAPMDNGAFIDDGSVSVFERDELTGDWSFVVKLTAPDPGSDAQFGTSIALDGDRLIVGAIGDDENGAASGAAYVFERDLGGADQWGLRTKLLADTGGATQSSDQFGFDVSIDGDRAAVGAIKRDLGGVFSGAVYVFARELGGADSWGQEIELIPSDAHSGQWFGSAVSIEGELLAIGAVNSDNGAFLDEAGKAYLFAHDGDGVWSEKLIITNADEQEDERFGSSLVLDSDRLAIGARLDVEDALDGGSVSVLELDDCGGCVADLTGDGLLDVFDVFAFLNAFNSMDPVGDFTGDGQYDVFDVFAYLNLFNQGCP
jgi:hypothetical protein